MKLTQQYFPTAICMASIRIPLWKSACTCGAIASVNRNVVVSIRGCSDNSNRTRLYLDLPVHSPIIPNQIYVSEWTSPHVHHDHILFRIHSYSCSIVPAMSNAKGKCFDKLGHVVEQLKHYVLTTMTRSFDRVGTLHNGPRQGTTTLTDF